MSTAGTPTHRPALRLQPDRLGARPSCCKGWLLLDSICGVFSKVQQCLSHRSPEWDCCKPAGQLVRQPLLQLVRQPPPSDAVVDNSTCASIQQAVQGTRYGNQGSFELYEHNRSSANASLERPYRIAHVTIPARCRGRGACGVRNATLCAVVNEFKSSIRQQQRDGRTAVGRRGGTKTAVRKRAPKNTRGRRERTEARQWMDREGRKSIVPIPFTRKAARITTCGYRQPARTTQQN